MTISEELLALANRLETKARQADADADDHEQNHESSLAKHQRNRAKDARHYVEVCKHAAKLLKAREKRGAFTPPEWAEFADYCREKLPFWPVPDMEKWFDHFNANGWKVGGKAQMADWKAAARNGARNWKEKNPQAVVTKGGGEPEEWAQFLKSARIPYQPYKYAPAHWKNDFAKWLKEKR